MAEQNKGSSFINDLGIIVLSIIIAWIMIEANILKTVLDSTSTYKNLSSFVSGIFFTSIFTTAPAIVALGEISESNSLIQTAFFGAIGAVVGDLLIFSFIRDRLSGHFFEVVKHDRWWRRIRQVFRLKYFRWLTFLLGGLILASPFPDELGISMLGFTKMKTKLFVSISFLFNFIGIFLIGYIAKGF